LFDIGNSFWRYVEGDHIIVCRERLNKVLSNVTNADDSYSGSEFGSTVEGCKGNPSSSESEALSESGVVGKF